MQHMLRNDLAKPAHVDSSQRASCGACWATTTDLLWLLSKAQIPQSRAHIEQAYISRPCWTGSLRLCSYIALAAETEHASKLLLHCQPATQVAMHKYIPGPCRLKHSRILENNRVCRLILTAFAHGVRMSHDDQQQVRSARMVAACLSKTSRDHD